MTSWLFVGLMALGGALIAWQTPINAQLAKHVGVFEASTVSFTVGLIFLLILVATVGKGSLRALPQAPTWQWFGGLCGMGFVTLAIVCVPRIGVTPTLAAALVGQLVMGMVLDSLGWIGMPQVPFSWVRAAGIPLLFGGLWLIQKA